MILSSGEGFTLLDESTLFMMNIHLQVLSESETIYLWYKVRRLSEIISGMETF